MTVFLPFLQSSIPYTFQSSVPCHTSLFNFLPDSSVSIWIFRFHDSTMSHIRSSNCICRHAKCLNNLFPLEENFTKDEIELLSLLSSQTNHYYFSSPFSFSYNETVVMNEERFLLPRQWIELNEMPKGRLTVGADQKCYNEKPFSAFICTGFVIMCIENEWLTIYFRRKSIPIFFPIGLFGPQILTQLLFRIASFLKIIFLAFNSVCMLWTLCIVHRFVFYFSKCDQSTFKKNCWSISHCISVHDAFRFSYFMRYFSHSFI